MKKNFFIFIQIFIVLSLSRFIPHPPNFTSLIAMSFYIPLILGRNYIYYLLVSFVITDFVIGYHNTTHWTWGSVIIIGSISGYFFSKNYLRICGSLFSALVFFIITNFGVWTTGMYDLTIKGLYECFFLAIPFFYNSLISTLIFSLLIEASLLILDIRLLNKKIRV